MRIGQYKFFDRTGLRLEVEVPVNTSATVYLPVKSDAKNVVAAMAPVASGRDRMAFKVGSWKYTFEIR